MISTLVRRRPFLIAVLFGVGLVAASCGDSGPASPAAPTPAASEPGAGAMAASADAELNRALAQLRAATARYHDLAAAEADGFVMVTECEAGEVASVYVKPDRIDGALDPSAPEGLLYEPSADGRARLVGVELVLPYGYGGPEPPEFLGHPFQAEDEFGVWGLHVWVWRHNPEGMFAFANPKVSCAP